MADMAEKTSTDSPDEKHIMRAPEPELADVGRRKSVALNIVENPLKVSSNR